MWTIEQKKISTFQSVHNVCVRARLSAALVTKFNRKEKNTA